MQTRSRTRALAPEHTTVVVTPSATGQGVHTRWVYPPKPPGSPSPPSRSLGNKPTSKLPVSPETPCIASLSWSSGSSLTTLSDSSLSSISSASEHDHSQTYNPFDLPPPHPPTALQHNASGQQWAREGNSWRLVLVPDSFSPEEISMRERMIQRELDKVSAREWVALMKSREQIIRARLQGGDYDSEGDDDWMDDQYDDHRPAFVREDTEPAEDIPPLRPQQLGPHGTELVTPEPSDCYYGSGLLPPLWNAPRENSGPGLRWRPTEKVIN